MLSSSLVAALLVAGANPAGALAPAPDRPPELSRRSALQRTVASIYAGGFVATGGVVDAAVTVDPEPPETDPLSPLPLPKQQQQPQPRLKKPQSFASAYQVFPDVSPALNPQIKSVSVSSTTKRTGNNAFQPVPELTVSFRCSLLRHLFDRSAPFGIAC